jgi:3'-phosphoadenosine 5'-phosphosulfate (PAPS) 3'-phosphatase
MSESAFPLQLLCDAATRAALAAGQLIQRTDRSTLQRRFKAAGSSAASQLVTELDVRSEALIRHHLQAMSERWDIAFVGEESSPGGDVQKPERLRKPYYWCVDPLDGTLPFVEGRAGYAVSIALVDQSGVPLIGVVYDPVDATLIQAIRGKGAYRNEAVMTSRNTVSPSLMVFADASFRAHPSHDEMLAILNTCAKDCDLNGVTMVFGSGAVKNACQVLDYPAACYVKLPKHEDGGGSIWDYAATACIVSEAGGWASNIRGNSLELNRPDSTFMNHQGVIYASNPVIAHQLIEKMVNYQLLD